MQPLKRLPCRGELVVIHPDTKQSGWPEYFYCRVFLVTRVSINTGTDYNYSLVQCDRIQNALYVYPCGKTAYISYGEHPYAFSLVAVDKHNQLSWDF